MKKYKLTAIIIIFLLAAIPAHVFAQSPDLPVYIVQPGDTLYTIAVNFHVSVDDILAVNAIENPNWLSEGDQIRIPGYEGIQGQFVPYTIQLQDTYQSLINSQILDEANFIKINQITSPNELIAGKDIILPINTNATTNETDIQAGAFHSPLLKLVAADPTSWTYTNQDIIAESLSDNDILITEFTIAPFPLQQGKTSIIHFKSAPAQNLQFLIDNSIIPIIEYEPGAYTAFYGINAISETGLREIILQSLLDNGSKVLYSQNLLSNNSTYARDPVIVVEPEYIDPVNTMPEEEELFELASHFTMRDLWDGSFSYPVDEPCIRSPYGSIRSYNNGPFDTFHTGIDFGTCAANLNIYAPGSGRVVHAGEWFVRGNSIVIDHGWGVYTGYWHLASLDVQVGDIVQEGQILGIIGSTGRSTGSHLHWEVLVNDVQVDPIQWLDITVPE